MAASACSSERDVRLHVLPRADAADTVRRLLAELAGVSPDRLRLCHGPHGKPRIAADTPLGFNLSHSGSLCVVAIVECGEVGVDVERVVPRRACPRSAQRVLTAPELERWTALPDELRAQAFFALWTAKEACLKALGYGLSVSPHEVDMARRDPDGAVRVRGARLAVRPLAPAVGYVGALALPASGSMPAWP